MAIPLGYKLAAGAVVATGIVIYLRGRRAASPVAAAAEEALQPPSALPAAPARSAWSDPPPSAFVLSPPVARSLTHWETEVLSAYYKPDFLATAVIHIGQWAEAGVPAGADYAAVTRGSDIYFNDPDVVFTDPVAMSTLAHELFHVAEFATGMTYDQYAAGKAAARAGHPSDNPFEGPAYALEHQVFADLTGASYPVSGLPTGTTSRFP